MHRPARLTVLLAFPLAFAVLAPAASARAEAPAVEEVVVTARWREERLLETPVSITAFTGDDLAARGVTNLAQIAPFTPNLVFDPGVGDTGGSANAQVYIRGVGQSDFLFTTEPGVGVYVDGVYRARSIGAMIDLLDVERVEVLRGPQGAAFGKNSVGGAINIVTRQPADTPGGRAYLILGDHGRRDAFATVDTPLAPGVLALKATGLASRRDGDVARADGVRLGEQDALGGALQLRWSPGAAFEVLLAADSVRRRDTPSPTVLLAVDPAAPLLALWNGLVGPTYDARFVPPGRDASHGTGPARSDLDQWGVSATARWRLPAGTLRAIAAHRRDEARFDTDADQSPLAYAEQGVSDRMRQSSLELQWLGSAMGGRLDYVLGGLDFSEAGDDLYRVRIAPGLFGALEALPPGVIPGLGGAGNPVHVGLDYDAAIAGAIDSRSRALFAFGDYRLGEALSLSAGLRQTWDRKAYRARFDRFAAGVRVYDTEARGRWSALTPTVALRYRWAPGTMTYLSAARGYKAGGFNGRSQTEATARRAFDPEYVWTYEAGLKMSGFDRRLALALTVFRSDYTDLQLMTLSADGAAPVVVVENAGAARIDGFEAELTAAPIERLRLNAGVGHLDGRYRRLDPAVSGLTLDGRLPKAPAWTFNLGVERDLDTPAGRLTLRGDYAYRSAVENTAENSPLLRQEGFGLLNAQARLQPDGTPWSLSVFAANLGDVRYITNGLDTRATIGVADATVGRPREWGLRLERRF